MIAKSIDRIFYRSAINQGLQLIETTETVDIYNLRDEVSIDSETGMIMISRFLSLDFHLKSLRLGLQVDC